ncbi:hypothetical protein BJ508DRAFT_331567 [Ascobolus immersus RN42]|uniref:SWI5-dependent HO expression protein 3 n=1 Tax=Ascobolus immersus RN42 TaxID=1160509 RepID=A0A3N4HQI5_ASCIM|nr:hypothetical protein BJ508DRAFT_331567 [Ascobolus immersus RN42]
MSLSSISSISSLSDNSSPSQRQIFRVKISTKKRDLADSEDDSDHNPQRKYRKLSESESAVDVELCGRFHDIQASLTSLEKYVHHRRSYSQHGSEDYRDVALAELRQKVAYMKESMEHSDDYIDELRETNADLKERIAGLKRRNAALDECLGNLYLDRKISREEREEMIMDLNAAWTQNGKLSEELEQYIRWERDGHKQIESLKRKIAACQADNLELKQEKCGLEQTNRKLGIAKENAEKKVKTLTEKGLEGAAEFSYDLQLQKAVQNLTEKGFEGAAEFSFDLQLQKAMQNRARAAVAGKRRNDELLKEVEDLGLENARLQKQILDQKSQQPDALLEENSYLKKMVALLIKKMKDASEKLAALESGILSGNEQL